MNKPRTTPTAKQRVVVIRMPGALHARLCDERLRTGHSINQIVLNALACYVRLPIVSPEHDPVDLVADYPAAARVDAEAGTYDFAGEDDKDAF